MGSILDTFIASNTFCAFELFSKAGNVCVSFIKVKKNGSSLRVEKQQVFEKEDEFRATSLNAPAIVILNTDNVLVKEIEVQEPNEKKILFKAFPNVKSDDFYYEIWLHKQRAVVAIVRKEYLDKVIGSYKNLKIAGVFLGINAVSNLEGLELPETFLTNTHRLSLSNNAILSFDKNTKTVERYTINGIELESKYLNAFGGILQMFTTKKTSGSLTILDTEIHENFKQEAFFRKGLSVGVVMILGLLIVNFFLFNHYYDNVQQQESMAQSTAIENQIIHRLQKQIKEKEGQIKNFEDNGNRPVANYLNDIASGVPKSILLEEFTVNPLVKKVKQEELIRVEEGQAIIKGVTLNTAAFTGWIKTLQSYRFIKQAKIISFSSNESGGNAFSILILLSHDTQ